MEIRTIYLICAVAGGAVLVLRLILMFVGIDHGDVPGDTDIPVEAGNTDILDAGSYGGGYNFLSLQSIAGFFTMFGLVGMGLLEIHVTDVLSLVGALVAGAFTAVCTWMIFFYMHRLQSEGTLVLSNAVGQTGTVYLKIPEKGCGVVNVTVQGVIRSLDAVSEHGNQIQTGSIVRVTGITAGKILIVSEQPVDTNLSQ